MTQEPEQPCGPGMSAMLQLGNIVNTHGVRGLLRLQPFNPQTDTLTNTREVFLSQQSGGWQRYELLSASRHGRCLLLSLQGVDSIEKAQPLIGCKLSVPESALPELHQGEYYAYKLKNLLVVTPEGREIGKVYNVEHTSANDILVVREGDAEHLIPMVNEIIREVDLAEGRIVVSVVEGMLE